MIVENELLLAEYRLPGPCDFCGKLCRVREPCHAIAKGMGGGRRMDVPLNLLAGGSSRTFECGCHRRQHDTGTPSRLEMLKIAADREFGQGFCDPDGVQSLLWEISRTPTSRDEENCDHGECWRVGQSWITCKACSRSFCFK